MSELEVSSYRGQPLLESTERVSSSNTTASRPTQPAGAHYDSIAQKHAIDYPLDIVDPSDFAKVHTAMLGRLATRPPRRRRQKRGLKCQQTSLQRGSTVRYVSE